MTDVSDQLHEDSRKINTVDRFSRHLGSGIPAEACSAYLQAVRMWIPSEPVIHINDSNVVKPENHEVKVRCDPGSPHIFFQMED